MKDQSYINHSSINRSVASDFEVMDSAKRKMKTNKKKKMRNLSLIKVLFFINLLSWGVMTVVLNQILLNTNKIYFTDSSSEEIIDIEKFLTALTLS